MTREQARAEGRRRRGDIAAVVGALVVGAFLAWLVLAMQGLRHDLAVSNQARDALARQVRQLGGKPVAGAPGSRGDPGLPGVPGPAGARGPVGPAGPRGVQGERGPVGSAGRAGDRGVSGPAGVPGVPGAIGASGVDGVPGSDGAPGAPGPAGPQGGQGPVGPPGPQGDRGERGPAGPSCPDGYSLQPARDDPDALVCRRDGAPTPEDPPQGLLSPGLDPTRRQYP